jgi:hypothetical protein
MRSSGANTRVLFGTDDTGNGLVIYNNRTGLGTVTPTAKLHVKGTGTTSATTSLLVENANLSSSLIVLDDGNVGIGTATPTSTLDINGTIRTNNNILSEYASSRITTTPTNNAQTFGFDSLFSGETRMFAGYVGSTTTYGTNTSAYFGSPAGYRISFGVGASERMGITTSGNVGIGTTTPAYKLDVSGSGNFTNNLTVTGSFTVTTGSLIEFQVNQTGVKIGNATTDLHSVTGSIAVSASAGTGSALTVYKSGSTVMSIQGSQGELFSITDSLSGSLFSVSNISGLPILEVFSDNTVLLGNYLDPMLLTTQKVTANSGSTVIYSLPTASYDGVFMDYVIRSGSSARAGQFMGLWSGSSTNIVDSSTTDFGDTSGFVFALVVSGSNMVITGSATTNSWTVRAGIRSI